VNTIEKILLEEDKTETKIANFNLDHLVFDFSPWRADLFWLYQNALSCLLAFG
jgi:hypothetical protein